MYKKSKVFVVIAVFILQMIMYTQLFISDSYAAIQPLAISMPTSTASISIGKLKVEFYNSSRNSKSNTLYQNFRVTNLGSTAVDLSTVKLRYYYTIDLLKSQNFYCDWSTVGSQNITGTFVKYDKLHNNADYYLEIGFTSGAGNLSSGSSIEVKTRIAKTDWSDYTQSNDYSFNEVASNYTEWNYVTAFIAGDLVWGIPPEELTSTPTPEVHGLKVEFYNNKGNSTSNTIYQNIRLTNIGNTTIELSEVKIRYYYTIDTDKSQNFWCDWSSVGSGNVTGTFIKYVTPFTDADYYLEIGFTSEAGNLDIGSNIEVKTRIAKTDWSNYSQTNDYSFIGGASKYMEWDYVTAYINGNLVWGIPPEGIPAAPTQTITPTPTLYVTPTCTPTSTPTITPNPTITLTLTPTITSTPTSIRTPGPSQTPGTGNGLRGEYYDNIDFSDIKLITIDNEVNFKWGYDSPNSYLGSDNFSVRWIGEVEPLYSEQYTFYTISDDGIKLWVDDILLIDNRTEDATTEAYGTIDLEEGKRYDIRIEYFDKADNATAMLLWSSESQEKEVIPQTQLYPSKIFTALNHKVRTVNNNFAIGDFVPLMLELQVMWPIENPVISIDLNLRKPDSTASGFILRERKSKDITIMYENIFKINVNGINETNFTVSPVGVEPNRKLNILISRSFSKYDKIQVYYILKASDFDAKVKDDLYNVNLNVSYEIIQWRDLGLDINDRYNYAFTNDMYEKMKFKADIKLEDPILLE